MLLPRAFGKQARQGAAVLVGLGEGVGEGGEGGEGGEDDVWSSVVPGDFAAMSLGDLSAYLRWCLAARDREEGGRLQGVGDRGEDEGGGDGDEGSGAGGVGEGWPGAQRAEAVVR